MEKMRKCRSSGPVVKGSAGWVLMLSWGYLVFASISWAQPESAISPPAGAAYSQVQVRVRTVRAIERSAEAEKKEKGAALMAVAPSQRVDRRLSDLSPKLQKLPFRDFNMLSSEELLIPVLKRQSISLSSGQTLVVRPLYVEERKVGLWIHWQDASGAELLDTRMHITPGESVIAGTDNSPSSGVVLAIEVEPVH